MIGRWRPSTGAPAGANTASDGYLFLYANSFDPLNPLVNVISSDDDFLDAGANCSVDIGCSFLPSDNTTLNLTAGVTYFAIASSFRNTGNADVPTLYTVDINTPGAAQVTFVTVPEPSSILGLVGLGLLGMGFQLKKRLK